MSHTKGPWEYKPAMTKGSSDLMLSGNTALAVFKNYLNPCDANLIAAAPELLEALINERRVRELGQNPDIHWESLRDERRNCNARTDAAIAKAKGETK